MKVLWLKTELLHPVDKGGKIRTYQMLRELRKEHHITYLTLDDGTAASDAIETAQEYAHEVITVQHEVLAKFSGAFYGQLASNLFSSFPYFVSKYRSHEMEAKIAAVVERGQFDVIICDFLVTSINLPKRLRGRSVLFQHNVESMIWKRHFEVATNPLKKAYLRLQWKRAVRYESTVCREFKQVIAVSADDARFFKEEYGVENVADVPTGVDLDYFTPRDPAAKKSANIVFTGSMDWLPNHDAIEWFIHEILPIVRKSIPNASLTVVGRNPFPSLVEMANRDPLITVTGRVPDVRPYMREATVYAVPIRIGGGTRLKIYEAMAMELPIVSTTIGAEGLPLRDGDDVSLSDSPDEFAAAIVSLIEDNNRADSLGSSAGNRAREEFGWGHVGEKFSVICAQL